MVQLALWGVDWNIIIVLFDVVGQLGNFGLVGEVTSPARVWAGQIPVDLLFPVLILNFGEDFVD